MKLLLPMCRRAEERGAGFDLITTKNAGTTEGTSESGCHLGNFVMKISRIRGKGPLVPARSLLSNPRTIQGNLQLAEFLAELPGILADPVDGILAQMKLPQHQQAVEPAFGDLSEVVMV